jgi:hypothetical protein
MWHSMGRALLAGAALLWLAAVPAGAATLTTFLGPFTGDPAVVQITLDDLGPGSGDIEVRVEVIASPSVGDIRGVFLNVADDTLLAGLTVTGSDVTDFLTRLDTPGQQGITNLGNGNNLNGGGSPCPCDIGVEIGSPGIGKDDVFATTFVLSNATRTLELADFDGLPVGVRLTSVGLLGGAREGSSKLFSTVPEPSSAALLALGLGGLARRGARRTRS